MMPSISIWNSSASQKCSPEPKVKMFQSQFMPNVPTCWYDMMIWSEYTQFFILKKKQTNFPPRMGSRLPQKEEEVNKKVLKLYFSPKLGSLYFITLKIYFILNILYIITFCHFYVFQTHPLSPWTGRVCVGVTQLRASFNGSAWKDDFDDFLFDDQHLNIWGPFFSNLRGIKL